MSKIQTQEGFNQEKTSNIKWVDPRLISFNKDWNPRQDYGDLTELMNSIVANGVRKPLQGSRKPDGKIEVTDGFRRSAAIQMAMEQNLLKLDGPDAVFIPFILEGKGYLEVDRLFDTYILNDGKALTPVEKGNLFNRLATEHKMSRKAISAKTGVVEGHISRLISLSQAPQEVLDLISNNTISPSVVMEIQRKTKPEDLVGVVQKAVETAKTESATTSATTKTGKAKKNHGKVTAQTLEATGVRKKSPHTVMKEVLAQLNEAGIKNVKVNTLNYLMDAFAKGTSSEKLVDYFRRVK